jgi:hypothetical protein
MLHYPRSTSTIEGIAAIKRKKPVGDWDHEVLGIGSFG